MIIDLLVLGMYENNCYVVRKNKQSSDCIVIDTGLETQPLTEFLENSNLNPVAVLCTHGHADHIAGVVKLRKRYPHTKVVIHKNDADMLTDPQQNLSNLANINITTEPADVIIESQNQMEFAGLTFDILETPGHTPGGVSYYFANDYSVLFCGDTIFAGSIGRTDFPGYDQEKCQQQLIQSVENKIFTLPEHTKLYPGHGPFTSVANEKDSNPFFANI